jgi:hypothetical protein
MMPVEDSGHKGKFQLTGLADINTYAHPRNVAPNASLAAMLQSAWEKRVRIPPQGVGLLECSV